MRRVLLLLLVGCGRPVEVLDVEPNPTAASLPKPPPTAWVKQVGGDSYTTVNGVAAAPDGTLFFTGNFQGKATFGKGEPHEVTFSSVLTGGILSGNCDIFVAALNSDGSLKWARHPAGSIRPDQLSSRNSGIGVALPARWSRP